jgi:hypothetical protein
MREPIFATHINKNMEHSKHRFNGLIQIYLGLNLFTYSLNTSSYKLV